MHSLRTRGLSKGSAALALTRSKNCGEYLSLLLNSRKSKNPRYSLRSLARDLEVSPTTLCYLFKKQRKISTFSALKISQNLQVTESELEHWHSLILLENQNSPELQNYILERQDTGVHESKNQNEIDLKSYQVIAEWQHLALLAATELQKPLKNKELAKLFKVEETVIQDSINRLKNLGLLHGEDAKYQKAHSINSIKSRNKNYALQIYHREMLEKAKAALLDQTNEKKYVGTVTLAIDPEQINELQDVFRSFIKKVIRVADKSKKKKRVYHLSVNFFDLFGNNTI